MYYDTDHAVPLVAIVDLVGVYYDTDQAVPLVAIVDLVVVYYNDIHSWWHYAVLV